MQADKQAVVEREARDASSMHSAQSFLALLHHLLSSHAT